MPPEQQGEEPRFNEVSADLQNAEKEEVMEPLVSRLGNMPGVLQWRKWKFDRRFAAGWPVGACRGVFGSLAEAEAAAPKTLPLGYDHEQAANMYRDRISQVYASDYPMMFWLQKAFDDGVSKVFDLGGHVGVSYYSYRRALAYPPELSWAVHDLPAVMRSGRELALERGVASQLSFASSADEASEAELLFTAGCLQYMDRSLGEQMASLQKLPRWLLINLLPLHSKKKFWTVQNIRTAFCPYKIQRDDEFFAELQGLGYELVDRWENPDKACWIAFEPDLSLDRYYGAALKLRSKCGSPD